MRNPNECLGRLQALGVTWDDACAMRRISMTLHRWHELECGDGNNYGSWCVTRGSKQAGEFIHDDDGAPFLEHHHYRHGQGDDSVTYAALPDREKGARRRLAKLLERYPDLVAYVQTDPRGCALYVLPRASVQPGEDLSCVYTRGVAVYK